MIQNFLFALTHRQKSQNFLLRQVKVVPFSQS
jgi:hypothetical protein